MKRRIALYLVGLVVILLGATTWFYLASPVRAVEAYMAETYPAERAPLSVQLDTWLQDPSHVTVWIVARFARDPDYGSSSGAPPDSEYAGSVRFTRHGLRWVPDRGFRLGDGTTGVLAGIWAATDPDVEGARRMQDPCG